MVVAPVGDRNSGGCGLIIEEGEPRVTRSTPGRAWVSRRLCRSRQLNRWAELTTGASTATGGSPGLVVLLGDVGAAADGWEVAQGGEGPVVVVVVQPGNLESRHKESHMSVRACVAAQLPVCGHPGPRAGGHLRRGLRVPSAAAPTSCRCRPGSPTSRAPGRSRCDCWSWALLHVRGHAPAGPSEGAVRFCPQGNAAPSLGCFPSSSASASASTRTVRAC
jgi:hypothetical protein